MWMPWKRSAGLFFLLFTAAVLSFGAQPARRPKLVIGIIVDQFRYDYLTRFRSEYHGGFDQMMRHGADFTNAFYNHVPTVTAVGHSIFMSGAMPAVSGIVGNSWFDRQNDQMVTSVCDWDQKVVGGEQPTEGKTCTDADPASPNRLLVSTLGDELRTANSKSKVIGISLKARAAILPSGHRAAGAYWFDDESGNFITSSFYMEHLPEWAEKFNGQHLPASYVDRKWDGFPDWNFHGAGKHPYAKLPASPWGNELVESFAESALKGEQLGARDATDLLTVSFSSNDYIGHRVGPDAPEVRDMCIRTDQMLAKLFAAIDETVGLQNTIVVLSADHGVASTPAFDKENKMPGGHIAASIETVAEQALEQKFGAGPWVIPDAGEAAIYFDARAMASRKTSDGRAISRQELAEAASESLMNNSELHVARVYSRGQLEAGIAGDFIAQAEMNGFNARRSGDLAVVFEPGYVLGGASGTTHFTPYAYDRHVPVMFMGPGIKAGWYDITVCPNDIAPTLATMLQIQTPSGSSGRVLTEMLVP